VRSSAAGVPLRLPDFQGPAWMRQEQDEGEGEAFGVLPENWDAACVFFLECPTQWRRDQGVIAGLRYDALELIIRHHGCAEPDDVFRRVQILERASVERARRLGPKPA
jgi:hypothetical protein